MLGRIVASNYGVYEVISNDSSYLLKPRGVFRHQDIKPCVGDFVEFDEVESVITGVKERKNYLIRPTIANVDEVAIVMSLVEPKFSMHLINKFLSYANFFAIPASVILTKTDRKDNEDEINRITSLIQSQNVKILPFSKVTNEGIEDIKEAFKDKVVVLMGQTGVGKSSLLNALIPFSNRDIGEYSKALGRGKHKTKDVTLIKSETGFIGDTPGFSSLELPFFKEDLAKCFPNFSLLASKCKFDDCLHYNAKECAILKAVEEGIIKKENYEDYLTILQELKHRKDRY